MKQIPHKSFGQFSGQSSRPPLRTKCSTSRFVRVGYGCCPSVSTSHISTPYALCNITQQNLIIVHHLLNTSLSKPQIGITRVETINFYLSIFGSLHDVIKHLFLFCYIHIQSYICIALVDGWSIANQATKESTGHLPSWIEAKKNQSCQYFMLMAASWAGLRYCSSSPSVWGPSLESGAT